MIKSKKILFPACALFIAAEIYLSYLIQISAGDGVILPQYISVILACLFCFISIEKTKTYFLTQGALIATVCADYFLIYVPERQQLYGMLCFSVAQLLYFLRIYLDDESKKRKKAHLILRFAVSVLGIAATILVLGEKSDAVALVSVFYYANLVLNLIFSFIQFKSSKLLAIGLLCFLLCDTVIGLANIGPYFQIEEDSFIAKLLDPGFDPAWMFYVPSQALLAMSVLPKKFRKI